MFFKLSVISNEVNKIEVTNILISMFTEGDDNSFFCASIIIICFSFLLAKLTAFFVASNFLSVLNSILLLLVIFIPMYDYFSNMNLYFSCV